MAKINHTECLLWCFVVLCCGILMDSIDSTPMDVLEVIRSMLILLVSIGSLKIFYKNKSK